VSERVAPQWRAAVHEAAHGLVACALPRALLRVKALTLLAGERYEGRMFVDVAPIVSAHAAEDMCLLLLAGYEAEGLLTGWLYPRGAATDLRQAGELVAELAQGRPGVARALRSRLHDQTRQVLRAGWPAVEAVASALMARETVSGAQLRAVVTRALGGRPRLGLPYAACGCPRPAAAADDPIPTVCAHHLREG